MDLVSFVSGVNATKTFSPGINTPSAFFGPHTGMTDGTSPATASVNQAEIYNRILLQINSVFLSAGITIDNTNWLQMPAAIQAIAVSEYGNLMAQMTHPWLDQTSIHVAGTTYYNTDQWARAVALTFGTTTMAATGQLLVNGVAVGTRIEDNQTGTTKSSLFAIVPPGASYQYTGASMPIAVWAEMSMALTSPSTFTFVDTIATNRYNYNLAAAATTAGWNGYSALNATVTINSGVYVGSVNNSVAAFTTGSGFSSGTTLNLINNGYILGIGGAGDGGAGGPALTANYQLYVTNNGVIGGGGGGGGAGAEYGYLTVSTSCVIIGYTCGGKGGSPSPIYGPGPSSTILSGSAAGGGGGGGAGFPGGSAGAIQGSNSAFTPISTYGATGSAGTASAGGAGGAGAYGFVPGVAPNNYCTGGSGGSGGGLGASGSPGGLATYAGQDIGGPFTAGTGPYAGVTAQQIAYQAGGAPGKCTTTGSNANITWINIGTRYGTVA